MEDVMLIAPLSYDTLQGALEVLNRVFGMFPDDKMQYTRGFYTSLGSKEYLHLYEGERPSRLQYYVAMDKSAMKVVGTAGLYEYSEHTKDNAVGVGWFCVDPDYRGKNIGAQLLDFTIKKARELNKRYLRLWTTANPMWRRAREMYEKRGFKITKEELDEGEEYPTLYYELDLRNL